MIIGVARKNGRTPCERTESNIFFSSLLCKTGDGSNFKNTLKSYIVSTYVYIYWIMYMYGSLGGLLESK